MRIIIIILVSALLSSCNLKQNATTQGYNATKREAWNEFCHPEDSTRTKVWWFHGETETTREGITADLEAFKRVGVGGVVYYDQVHGKGEKALPAFSPQWWQMLRFAASEAKRIGLSFEINLSNGYVAGGPWISKAQSMQRLIASDTLIHGNQEFFAALPKPGNSEFWDIATLAFPISQGIWDNGNDKYPEVSSNLKDVAVKDIFFNSKGTLVNLPARRANEPIYITLCFKEPFTARSISYKVRPCSNSKAAPVIMNVPGVSSEEFQGHGFVKYPNIGELEVSNDGVNYEKVCDLKPFYPIAHSSKQQTISFPTTEGRYFRLNLHDWTTPEDKQKDMAIGNVELSSRVRMDHWEARAAFYSAFIENNPTPNYASSEIIDPAKIINLTNQVDTNGILRWNVPEGDWVIMRFAHESTGARNKHGRSNLIGLECDKMSVNAVKTHWYHYAQPIIDSLSAFQLKPLGVVMDSHEAGAQNWTHGFERMFFERQGYDPIKYLPAMMGYIVGSESESDAFLYDLRRTISDVISDNYYGTLQQLCDSVNIEFTAQATGNGLSLVADNLQAKYRVQKPQGEFWAKHIHGSYDIKEAVSAAHIYGKPIASAEAYTDANFGQSLAYLKNLADFAYALQLNEFVICASSYQPWQDKIPGNTGGGRQYCLNRNNTYWNDSKPFWDYQARCAGLLRKGMPIVDICIYAGQNSPIKLLTYRLPEIPEGYDFDICTSEGLLCRMSAEEQRIVLPDGMSYSMLVIQRNNDVPLSVLKHIASLLERGVPIYGSRPKGSASLKDAKDIAVYQQLVERLWGKEHKDSGVQSVGKGTLYWGMPLREALTLAKIEPDMVVKSANIPTDKIYYAHRHLVDADMYFINNHSDHQFRQNIGLRTTTAQYAEFWEPTTGRRYALPSENKGNGIFVSISLAAHESGFIVTSNEHEEGLNLGKPQYDEKITSIKGTWNVYFDPKWGGPGDVLFDKLIDWTKHSDSRIRYYSGTAIYKNTIDIDSINTKEQILLRFPRLEGIATVFINGKKVETIWCSPWETDIIPYLHEGSNSLEIKVVNSLMNRMIGDASLPQEKRYTYSFPEIVSVGDSLIPSGIIDSVLLVDRTKDNVYP